MIRGAVLLALVALAVSGCGGAGGGHHAAVPNAPQGKRCPATTKALAKIQADIAALQHTRSPARMSTLTDRFLLDVDTAPIGNLQRNRLIDHAAAAVATGCPQCFQALEADRPIPAIRQGDVKCPKA